MAIRRISIAGIDRNKALLCGLTKATRIAMINDHAAGENHDPILLWYRKG